MLTSEKYRGASKSVLYNLSVMIQSEAKPKERVLGIRKFNSNVISYEKADLKVQKTHVPLLSMILQWHYCTASSFTSCIFPTASKTYKQNTYTNVCSSFIYNNNRKNNHKLKIMHMSFNV
jgi:hypothetical protein